MEVPPAVPQRVLAVVVVVAAAVAVVQVLLVAEAVQLVGKGSSNLAVCRTLPMLVCNQAAPPVLLVDLVLVLLPLLPVVGRVVDSMLPMLQNNLPGLEPDQVAGLAVGLVAAVVADHTAVAVGHTAALVVVEVAVHIAVVAHTDHTVTSPAVAADVVAAVVGSSQAGSSFVLDCNFLPHLVHFLFSP